MNICGNGSLGIKDDYGNARTELNRTFSCKPPHYRLTHCQNFNDTIWLNAFYTPK